LAKILRGLLIRVYLFRDINHPTLRISKHEKRLNKEGFISTKKANSSKKEENFVSIWIEGLLRLKFI
jgi:hypothetical protein